MCCTNCIIETWTTFRLWISKFKQKVCAVSAEIDLGQCHLLHFHSISFALCVQHWNECLSKFSHWTVECMKRMHGVYNALKISKYLMPILLHTHRVCGQFWKWTRVCLVTGWSSMHFLTKCCWEILNIAILQFLQILIYYTFLRCAWSVQDQDIPLQCSAIQAWCQHWFSYTVSLRNFQSDLSFSPKCLSCNAFTNCEIMKQFIDISPMSVCFSKSSHNWSQQIECLTSADWNNHSRHHYYFRSESPSS